MNVWKSVCCEKYTVRNTRGVILKAGNVWHYRNIYYKSIAVLFPEKSQSAERSEKRKNVSSLVRSKEAIKVNANSRASVQRSSFMNFREYFKSEFTRTTKKRERKRERKKAVVKKKRGEWNENGREDRAFYIVTLKISTIVASYKGDKARDGLGIFISIEARRRGKIGKHVLSE